MQINFRNTISVLAILAASGAAPALAQDLDIGEVVVTANKTPTEKAKVGSTVYVVTKKDMDKQSLPTLNDYLTLVPGLHVASPGGMGQESSLSMRVGEVADVLMADYGVWNALNLDGGGSTSMAMEDPLTHRRALVNVSSDRDNPSAGRSVGSSLVVFARPASARAPQ